MALKLRLSRAGAKKRPYYHIVVADSRSPRDGRFIEKVGNFNPLLPKDSDKRVNLKVERITYWLGVGARPTDRVARFLAQDGLYQWNAGNNPNKAKPGAKALARVEATKEKAAAADEAPKAAEEETPSPAEAQEA